MIPLLITITVLSMLALIIATFLLTICFIKPAYMFILEHKEWSTWENVCKHLNDATLNERFTSEDKPKLNSYIFHLSLPDGRNLRVIYWDNLGITSVHTEDECVASSWDGYHSQKATAFLREKVSQLNTVK